MPGVPEPPKPREEHGQGQKREELQSDEPANGGTLTEKQVEEIKHDPKAVVHCELQEELDKDFEQRGLRFDKPTEGEEGNKDSADKQGGDGNANQEKPAA